MANATGFLNHLNELAIKYLNVRYDLLIYNV